MLWKADQTKVKYINIILKLELRFILYSRYSKHLHKVCVEQLVLGWLEADKSLKGNTQVWPTDLGVVEKDNTT